MEKTTYSLALQNLNELLLLTDPERIQIVENMLETYITTLEKNYPHYLGELLSYLSENSLNITAFKHAINNINLVVSYSVIANDDAEFNQAVRRILMECRQDGEHMKKMKFYYLENLSYDDFSGIVSSEEEFHAIQARFAYFKEQYLNVVI